MQSERANLVSAFEAKVENSGFVRRLAHLVLPLFTKHVRVATYLGMSLQGHMQHTRHGFIRKKKNTRAVKYRLAVVTYTVYDDDERR